MRQRNIFDDLPEEKIQTGTKTKIVFNDIFDNFALEAARGNHAMSSLYAALVAKGYLKPTFVMDPKKFEALKIRVESACGISLTSTHNDARYLLQSSPSIDATESAHVVLFSLSSNAHGMPLFRGRWDDRASAVDIDLEGSLRQHSHSSVWLVWIQRASHDPDNRIATAICHQHSYPWRTSSGVILHSGQRLA